MRSVNTIELDRSKIDLTHRSANTIEFDPSEIYLSQKRSECERQNHGTDKIDQNFKYRYQFNNYINTRTAFCRSNKVGHQ